MKKFLSILLAVLMTLSVCSVPVFAEDAGGSLTDISEGSALNTGSIGGLIVSVFSMIIENIKKISTDDLLNLPVGAMADFVTFIFQILRVVGVNMDGVYDKLGGILGGALAA